MMILMGFMGFVFFVHPKNGFPERMLQLGILMGTRVISGIYRNMMGHNRLDDKQI